MFPTFVVSCSPCLLVTVTNQLILFLSSAFSGPPHCGRLIWKLLIRRSKIHRCFSSIQLQPVGLPSKSQAGPRFLPRRDGSGRMSKSSCPKARTIITHPAEVLALKHESRILGQWYNLFLVQGRAKPVRHGPHCTESNLFYHGETTNRVG